MKPELYKIEDIEMVMFNNKEVKSFKAFERQNDALGGYSYRYIGYFTAPADCPNDRLVGFIRDDNE